ncbi:MurR/RpiR family transcriptional regulator [Enterococcus sp. BWR-S5]|uniref:MurR/RpiR family transcriptional regulator n=1 Tax=Enterococcus sp. BWR-S5 TaxID=2787714 RepID=UPI0019223583|nr:MurR/RpiR family transcriptional regulator [Enterococcus sp. BWR-S5]MBL1224092.1 MurR/RpiR family transcriptional regulator [Enterococcus sp. BWR-S5]
MSFFGKINFNELSETDRAIYHFMASNSSKIPYMRVRDIAKESHTSTSSVMRFIRKIGYSSFTEFRSHFKVEDASESKGFDYGEKLLSKERFPEGIEGRLRKVAEKMVNCENIVFFGMGSSAAMCEYAARRAAIKGLNSFALVDHTYPLFSKLRNTTDNMLITLSVTGKTTEIVEIVNGFRNALDYTTVAITSDENSPLAKMTDYVLSYHVDVERLEQHQDLTSQIPCMYLIEKLIDLCGE